MLALHKARLRPQTLRPALPLYSPSSPCRRKFSVQSFSDGFLDLALALPIPPSLPPYSTTIILVTLVARFAILPVSIWGRNRTRRAEEMVVPEIQKLKPIVSKRVFEEMRAARTVGTKEGLKKMHAKKCSQILTARRKELFKEHNCSPAPSILVPILSQLPFFVGFTVILRHLSMDPTPFDSETFLTLSTLAHPDPTMTLPIIVGFLTLAQVESGNWVMNAAERQQQQRVIEEVEAKRAAEGRSFNIRPREVLKPFFRALSIARIILAAVMPGGVVVFWVTSAAFGLVQTWVMEWTNARRRRGIAAFQQALKARQPTAKR